MPENEQMIATIPWTELLSSGGVGVALAMCWLFLKHLREQRIADAEESKRKDETVATVTAEFSQTIRAVSTDVKDGMAKMQETQTILLADSRDREARLHEHLRGAMENK